jgi:hypothetical protein
LTSIFVSPADIGNGDPSLPQGFDEVIGAQNEKDVGEHQQGGDAFPCMDLREKTKESIQSGGFHRASDPFIVPLHDPVAKDQPAAYLQCGFKLFQAILGNFAVLFKALFFLECLDGLCRFAAQFPVDRADIEAQF